MTDKNVQIARVFLCVRLCHDFCLAVRASTLITTQSSVGRSLTYKTGPYIAHMPAIKVPTLMELAACGVAALPYDAQDDMVEDLVDMVVCAKPCDWCKTLCITRVPAARKLNANTCGWELFSLCGRRCVQAVVDDTMAQMATVEVPIVQVEVGVQ